MPLDTSAASSGYTKITPEIHIIQTCEVYGYTQVTHEIDLTHTKVTLEAHILRSPFGACWLHDSPRLKEFRELGRNAQTQKMLLELDADQRLDENICDHLFGWAVKNLNFTCCNNVADIEILYVDVLVALFDRLILDLVDRALVIRIDSNS